MRNNTTILSIFFCLCLVFVSIGFVEAHPGRTASDRCHTCRTNCNFWGVLWFQRHCHNGVQSLSPAYAATPRVVSTTATVVRVIDGDTVQASVSGQVYSVRLIGIDAPERGYSTRPAECFAEQATAYLHSLLNRRTVVLKQDGTNSNKDRYNRLLRYIELNGEDMNAKMVRNGYAYVYTRFPFSRGNAYINYQNQAKRHQVGVWAPRSC